MKNLKLNSRHIMDLLPLVADQKWMRKDNGRGDSGYIRNDKGECPACAVLNLIAGRTVKKSLPESVFYGWEFDRDWDVNFGTFIAAADDACIGGTSRAMRKEMLQVLNLAQ